MDEEKMKQAVKEALQGSKPRNFTQTVDIAVNLKNLDFKKPESRVKGDVELPHGRGKPTKVGVIAGGDLAERAKLQNLTVIIPEELEALRAEKRRARKLANAHDFFLAQADLMPAVGKNLGPVLGRKNKMPRPVPPVAPLPPLLARLEKTIAVDSKGKNTLHCLVGTEKMELEKLTENAMSVYNFVEKTVPKGTENIASVYIKTTMGKPVRVM